MFRKSSCKSYESSSLKIFGISSMQHLRFICLSMPICIFHNSPQRIQTFMNVKFEFNEINVCQSTKILNNRLYIFFLLQTKHKIQTSSRTNKFHSVISTITCSHLTLTEFLSPLIIYTSRNDTDNRSTVLKWKK